MKIVCFILMAIVFNANVMAQTVEVDKNTGLVKVDGVDNFYLIKKNKILMSYDLSLQNLQNVELAYFLYKNPEELTYEERVRNQGSAFKITFIETGNTAIVFPDAFAGVKAIAKMIVNGNWIKEGKIEPKAERTFVVSHNGKLYKDPNTAPINVVVNNAATGNKVSADIEVKGNNIYNSGELVGTFKKNTDENNLTTVSIYNKDETKIATATHKDNDAAADWNVILLADNKSTQILYNSATPLEKLFKYFVEKGHL
jgi:hypothetical protein